MWWCCEQPQEGPFRLYTISFEVRIVYQGRFWVPAQVITLFMNLKPATFPTVCAPIRATASFSVIGSLVIAALFRLKTMSWRPFRWCYLWHYVLPVFSICECMDKIFDGDWKWKYKILAILVWNILAPRSESDLGLKLQIQGLKVLSCKKSEVTDHLSKLLI